MTCSRKEIKGKTSRLFCAKAKDVDFLFFVPTSSDHFMFTLQSTVCSSVHCVPALTYISERALSVETRFSDRYFTRQKMDAWREEQRKARKKEERGSSRGRREKERPYEFHVSLLCFSCVSRALITFSLRPRRFLRYCALMSY